MKKNYLLKLTAILLILLVSSSPIYPLAGDLPPTHDLLKLFSVDEGELGDVVHVTITVSVPEGEYVELVDTLPDGLSYNTGSFMVDGVTVDLKVKKGEIKYTLDTPGSHILEYDVIVDTAKNWEDMEAINTVYAKWYDSEDEMVEDEESEASFTILAFEELHKNVGIPKADVVFSFDLTGSMSGVIGEAKLSAKDIIDSVGASIGDVAFGVISHSDYDFDAIDWYGYTGSYGGASDIPFILDQDITTNGALAKSAIETLGSYGGGDGPEDYTRMLSECQELSWRPDSVKFVIIFGDAPTHDNDFYDKNGNGDATDDYPGSYFVSTGGDPGPDVLRDTSDDLDFQTVVDELVTQEITVLSVFSPNYYEEWYNDMGRDTFMYMADETGGSYFELEDALEVSGAIADLVKAEAEETLTVHVGEEVQWAVVIDVVNPYDYSMTDVVITDRFGAEIEIEEVFSVTHGTVDLKTNGKSQKVFLKWDIGDLNHDEMARLVLLVSTDLNPAGHQEYTSPGVYELNSGATLKFKNSDGVQLSATTNHVYTTVLP